MDKGKLARILYKTATGETTAEGWHWEEYGAEYFELAEAVLKALEADVPTSLMGCLLSDEEMIKVISKELGYEEDSIDLVGIEKEVAKAQLQKVAPYIEAVKREAYKQGVTDQYKCQLEDIKTRGE